MIEKKADEFVQLALEIQAVMRGDDPDKIFAVWKKNHPQLRRKALGDDYLMGELYALAVNVWERCKELEKNKNA